MRRPSFQFYPGDWRTNANLRRCSPAGRGYWIDILGTLHDSDEYGLVRWPLIELANAAAVPLKFAQELASKSVLKGADRDFTGYYHTPKPNNRPSGVITLIEPCTGPVWYSSRLVRDEWLRSVRGGSTKFTADNQPSNLPSHQPAVVTRPIIDDTERLSNGASSSTSSSEESQSQSTSSALGSQRRAARSKRWDSADSVSQDWKDQAALKRAEHGLPTVDLDLEATKFCNHWIAQPGARGTKIDWRATWMNWALRAENPRNGRNGPTPHEKFALGALAAALEYAKPPGTEDNR